MRGVLSKSFLFMILFFMYCSTNSAIFTIENYTGLDIEVEIHTNKTWGPTTIRKTIANNAFFKFDTGVYTVPKGGVTWIAGGNSYYLPNVAITNPLMVRGVIRLFKSGDYEFQFLGSQSGYGRVRQWF